MFQLLNGNKRIKTKVVAWRWVAVVFGIAQMT
jgi:hypothetical protein